MVWGSGWNDLKVWGGSCYTLYNIKLDGGACSFIVSLRGSCTVFLAGSWDGLWVFIILSTTFA